MLNVILLCHSAEDHFCYVVLLNVILLCHSSDYTTADSDTFECHGANCH